jgi:hypothetical protein
MKITLKDISNYIEGNVRLGLDEVGLTQPHLKEQIAYRALMCKEDCATQGKCKHCGCGLPGRWYSTPSCNGGERFPDLMPEDKWLEFKKQNDIG